MDRTILVRATLLARYLRHECWDILGRLVMTMEKKSGRPLVINKFADALHAAGAVRAEVRLRPRWPAVRLAPIVKTKDRYILFTLYSDDSWSIEPAKEPVH